MGLPTLAPYFSGGPKELAPSEWTNIVETWKLLVDLYLQLPEKEFIASHGGFREFLTTYLSENGDLILQHVRLPHDDSLHKAVFMLLHRLLSAHGVPDWALDWSSLSNSILVFPRSRNLQDLLIVVLQKRSDILEPNLRRAKSEVISATTFDLKRFNQLMFIPMVSELVLTDTDFMDAMFASVFHQEVITVLYKGFLSLAQPDRPKYSLLADTIYIFRSIASYQPLLNQLFSQTRLLEELKPLLNIPEASRARDLLQDQFIIRPESRGKGVATDSLAQLLDLFPDLDQSVATIILEEHNCDVERATAALLEPPDESKNLPIRRNVFDNDKFDRLAVSSSAVQFERSQRTADDLLASNEDRSEQKEAIFSALATFDADEDERDDTYDVADVGGTVDTTEGMESEKDEETLFKTWQANPAIFQRDGNTRRSRERRALKTNTGWTDEAIEGWAIMLGRDNRKRQQLEQKFAFSGQQQQLPSTAYHKEDDGEEFSSARGRGRGRGYGRGNTGGSSSDRNTQAARQHRANHNRRDQRARKMGRGM
ncbi:hypothetical protein P152DRAFT_462927 [Eremomyces bilateralis CBS 781.70]|uniref:CUE domain-containing protein n=1 Tax=Eremomyces bilateralis CBS 781.70 TaxID=1392243 RepID=A0A6G1FQR4_9PEZI|nr:uncharacterized protein P152DRAFT_462927 [Eremomyces bilateralis CBS 781.70]KAF1808050.1 hypothetical protein P152DRAFT_462927 [Eremomyces bilateralis CBS 781.70]